MAEAVGRNNHCMMKILDGLSIALDRLDAAIGAPPPVGTQNKRVA
jgi:hypothetical protein